MKIVIFSLLVVIKGKRANTIKRQHFFAIHSIDETFKKRSSITCGINLNVSFIK